MRKVEAVMSKRRGIEWWLNGFSKLNGIEGDSWRKMYGIDNNKIEERIEEQYLMLNQHPH